MNDTAKVTPLSATHSSVIWKLGSQVEPEYFGENPKIKWPTAVCSGDNASQMLMGSYRFFSVFTCAGAAFLHYIVM